MVTPATPNGWTTHSTDSSGIVGTGTASVNFVAGPATPPLQTGSVNLATGPGAGDGSAQLRYGGAAGTRVDQLTALSYSTYATAWNGQQLPYLTLWLDLDGNGSRDDRLHFEPDYTAPAALNTWQTWNALSGQWYSDNEAGPGSNTISLAQYLALPGTANATIINDAFQSIGGIRLTTGFASDTDTFNTYIDNFTIGTAGGTTTFDFEPAAVPEAGSIALLGVAGVLSAAGISVRKRLAKRGTS